MKQTGRFQVDRKIFKYASKPLTKFEAWIWLCAAANPTGNERGCLSVTADDLSGTWGWSQTLVVAQLAEWGLPGDGRIITEHHESGLHIRLVNYDKYQDGDYSTGAVEYAPTDPTQIQAALDEVSLPEFHSQYSERIDVVDAWETFCTVTLYGTKQRPVPNPYQYQDMTEAFHRWCERMPDKPQDELRFCYDLPDVKLNEEE